MVRVGNGGISQTIIDWTDRNIKMIFTLPAVIFVLLMVVFPLSYTLWISLHEWNFSGRSAPVWVGFDNYAALLIDHRFWNSVKNTIYFSFGAVISETVLGVALAVFLNRTFKFKNTVKTLLLLPMVATPVAIALVWMLIYEPTVGIANYILNVLHIPPQLWLTSSETVIPSLILIDIWEWTPMVVLIVLAGLAIIPSEPRESAIVDGANAWQLFWQVTFPLLMPTIVVAFLLRMIDGLKTFDIIYSTTQGGPGIASETLNIYGYVLGFGFFKVGMGSALIMLFLVIVTLISFALIYIRNRAGVEQ